MGVEWNKIDIEGREFLISQGGQIVPISRCRIRQMVKAAEPVIGDYKKDLVSKGYKDSEVDTWIAFIKERIEYWKGQEKAQEDTDCVPVLAPMILGVRGPLHCSVDSHGLTPVALKRYRHIPLAFTPLGYAHGPLRDLAPPWESTIQLARRAGYAGGTHEVGRGCGRRGTRLRGAPSRGTHEVGRGRPEPLDRVIPKCV